MDTEKHMELARWKALAQTLYGALELAGEGGTPESRYRANTRLLMASECYPQEVAKIKELRGDKE